METSLWSWIGSINNDHPTKEIPIVNEIKIKIHVTFFTNFFVFTRVLKFM